MKTVFLSALILSLLTSCYQSRPSVINDVSGDWSGILAFDNPTQIGFAETEVFLVLRQNDSPYRGDFSGGIAGLGVDVREIITGNSTTGNIKGEFMRQMLSCNGKFNSAGTTYSGTCTLGHDSATLKLHRP